MTTDPKSNPDRVLVLTRIINAPPERVYRAFIDPNAMVKWLPPNGFTGHMHEMNAEEGGIYRMSFTNFSNGETHSFGGKFLELVPHKLIRYTDAFEDPNLPGTMETTIQFRKVLNGTEVTISQGPMPDAMPMEFATMGWQESLILLEKLVVPEIPSGPVSPDV